MSRAVGQSGSRGVGTGTQRALPYRWVGRKPIRQIRRLLIRWCYRPIIRVWLRGFTVTGTERIPSGPVIYAATHTSMADTPLLLWALGERADRTVVTAARDYFFRPSRPGFGPLVGLAFGAVPIDRTGSPRQSINDAITWLRNGFSLIIYPEGTIPTGTEGERQLHRGVALLARQVGCPVVPVRIEGASTLLPAGVHWPRRAVVRITFLQALLFENEENPNQFTERLSQSLFIVTT